MPARKPPVVRTLCIDIGGTGVKAMVVSPDGAPLTERSRLPTPQPATPPKVMAVIKELLPSNTTFERVSVGFPGVVVEGLVKTAPNLDPSWAGKNLARLVQQLTKRPTRALNDAGVQGHGVVEGKGVEVCITLGTGLGFSLFLDGRYVPNIEMAHHPLMKGRTYEEWLGNEARESYGKKRWNQRLEQAVELLERTFNYRVLYIGGGNAKKIAVKLPANVRVVQNLSGLLGGVKLWER